MAPSESKILLFDKKTIDAAIVEVANDIIFEFSKDDLNSLAFIGIQQRGIPFARRLAEVIKDKSEADSEVGTLDITMYRDDIGIRKTLPAIHETNIPFDVNNRVIILVDDVLQTGRTIRAALDALNHYGRPRLIRLAVLIDRGLREFPIRADYTGRFCELPKDRKIKLSWTELGDEEDAVYEFTRNPQEAPQNAVNIRTDI